MQKLIELEPVELNDAELAAVAGGLSVSNSNSTNSFNDVLDASGNTNSNNNSFNNATLLANAAGLPGSTCQGAQLQ